MKKLMLTIAMVLGAVGMSFAQNSATSTVTINGSVIQALQITPTSSTLNLGTMVAGTTPSAIVPSSGVAFTVTGNGATPITPTYNSTVKLYTTGDSLSFTTNFLGFSANVYASAVSAPSGTPVTLSGTNFNPGNYYFWLGGSVGAIPVAQKPGNYSGTFTLTVSY